jgi:hypothetical protein
MSCSSQNDRRRRARSVVEPFETARNKRAKEPPANEKRKPMNLGNHSSMQTLCRKRRRECEEWRSKLRSIQLRLQGDKLMAVNKMATSDWSSALAFQRPIPVQFLSYGHDGRDSRGLVTCRSQIPRIGFNESDPCSEI